jgi:hypothetical protein
MFHRAKNFNQDISGWCVEKIASKPSQFDLESGFKDQDDKQPRWGTPCTTILVSKKELTWADLPALDQPDNGSLKLLSTEVRDDVPVGWGSNGLVYETRTVYTYEADFDWDNYHYRGGGTNRDWIFDVLQFKNNQLKDGRGAFYGMRAEKLTALPDLDTSNLTSINHMFMLARYFDQPLDNFDLSNIEPGSSMKQFLYDAEYFNQDLSGWCVEHIGPVNNDWVYATGGANPIRPPFWDDPSRWPKWGEPCSTVSEAQVVEEPKPEPKAAPKPAPRRRGKRRGKRRR